MSLQDILNEKKKEEENEKNKELEKTIEDLVSHVKYLTELVESNQNNAYEQEELSLDLSAEPFKTLNRNDQIIFNRVKKLESGVQDELVEVHKKALDESISRLEKQHKRHEERINGIFKLKAMSSVTIYFISIVLLAIILGRVAIYGIFEGLGLKYLYNMSEWYYQVLAFVILIAIIYGVFYIVANGFDNIRRNHF